MKEIESSPFSRACDARGLAASRDFLAEFDATAARLGEQVTVTARTLRRWRQPAPRRPHARAWAVLEEMFGTNPATLGFPPRPAKQSEVDDVDRRSFVTDSLGMAATTVIPPGAPVGSVHVQELRQVLQSLYALDDAYGGLEVRSLAVRHLRRVRRVFNTGSFPQRIGRELQLLAGETAEHVAWLAYDADDGPTARRYWGEALTTATVLGDVSLEVLVLSALSMAAVHDERPREAYDLACTARRKATVLGSPVLLSLIAARAARAQARMSDPVAARRHLAEAMRQLDRAARGTDAPTPGWAAFHGRAELAFAQGLLYCDAGKDQASVPYLRSALDHQGGAYGRNKALYRLTLARGLARAGEADEAAAEAVTSLADLTEVESGRVRRRLREVNDLLRSSGCSAAREAVDAITPHLTQSPGGVTS